MGSADPLARVIENFVGEAGDLCAAITRDVLVLERNDGDPALNYPRVARALHTLKGSASTLGFDDLERLAHHLEGTLQPFQGQLGALPSPVADAILRGLDTFMLRLRAHSDGRGASLDNVEAAVASIAIAVAPSLSAAPRGRTSIEAAPISAEEPPEGGDSRTLRVDADQVLGLLKEVDRVRSIRLRLDERRRDVARVRSIVGEELGHGAATSHAEVLLARLDAAIATDGQDAADVVEALESGVKQIGTQPFRVLVDPLFRAVRDLCRNARKEATLSLVGGEISLDRRVLAALKGAIVHLVRNAVAHGIETPSQRRALGKHEEGVVVIRVEQQGNLMFIEVGDDGNGLDVAAIRRVALAKGLVTEAQLSTMTAKDVEQLIFLPALSTAGKVTPTSGRGIGMDVVKRSVEDLGGKIELQSIFLQGTRVILTFPAALGSSPLLIVRVEDHDLALPLWSVQSVAALKPSALHATRSEMRLTHEDELLPVVDLGALLGLRRARTSTGSPVVVVHSRGQRLALVVDAVLGDIELVIRPLPKEIAPVAAYQGASSLAGGELILVLRPDWILGAKESPRRTGGDRVALVVDDSLTARALHRAILEAGGYTVHCAAGVEQAFERLRFGAYDVVVCDLVMTPVGGLEFVRTMRARPETTNTPIVMVSGRDGDAEREQATAAGADAFVSKAHCAKGRLLAVLDNVAAHRRSRGEPKFEQRTGV